MRIYNDQPDGNEAADLEPARYINLAIEQINGIAELYKTSDKPVHVMLVHIDILIYVCKKYPGMGSLIKKNMKKDWEASFYSWFERVNSKIPAKFRAGIKLSAVSLFSELSKV